MDHLTLRDGLPHVSAYGAGDLPRTVTVTRYVTPLREGGSLPAIVEANDLGTYVLKFRGAGQGPKVLIAELLAGQVAHALGLPLPEIVFAELDPILARSEPDPEIQALLRASAGLNLALDYLPGSFAYEPVASPSPPPDLASAIVWFDAYLTNVDRTVRNTNLLVWHHNLWIIDNGASLYFHHTWQDYPTRARSPFPQIRDHVLLPEASMLAEMGDLMRSRLSPEVVARAVALIPETWLDAAAPFSSPEEHRAAYAHYLAARLEASDIFTQEAIRARAEVV